MLDRPGTPCPTSADREPYEVNMFNSASNSIAYEILMLESVLHRPLSRVERRGEACDQAQSILSVQYFPAGPPALHSAKLAAALV